jgi:hypothetical protein
MKIQLAIAILIFLAPAAEAAPITLGCRGSLNFPDNNSMTFDGDSAIIDLDAGTFKPPHYQVYSITRVNNTQVSFGFESSTASIFGTIDRISGNLSMNVMKPEDRKKLMAGGSVKMLSWLTAKCMPAKQMF